MNFDYLSDEELNYECDIRNILRNNLDAGAKKRALKRWDRDMENVLPTTVRDTFGVELQELEKKLNLVEGKCCVSKKLKNPALAVKIESCLHHINRRLNNLNKLGVPSNCLPELIRRTTEALAKVYIADGKSKPTDSDTQWEDVETEDRTHYKLKGAIPQRLFKKSGRANIRKFSAKAPTAKKPIVQEPVERVESTNDSFLNQSEQKELEEALKRVNQLTLKAKQREKKRFEVSSLVFPDSEDSLLEEYNHHQRTHQQIPQQQQSQQQHHEQQNRVSLSIAQRESNSFFRSVPVPKWKLRFDGSDKGKNVLDFLADVAFKAEKEEIPEYELFRSIHHLLEGEAAM